MYVPVGVFGYQQIFMNIVNWHYYYNDDEDDNNNNNNNNVFSILSLILNLFIRNEHCPVVLLQQHILQLFIKGVRRC